MSLWQNWCCLYYTWVNALSKLLLLLLFFIYMCHRISTATTSYYEFVCEIATTLDAAALLFVLSRVAWFSEQLLMSQLLSLFILFNSHYSHQIELNTWVAHSRLILKDWFVYVVNFVNTSHLWLTSFDQRFFNRFNVKWLDFRQFLLVQKELF